MGQVGHFSISKDRKNHQGHGDFEDKVLNTPRTA
jgi:hypothetical protein